MSHPEQMAFLKAVVQRNQPLLENASVLEIGSYDVNGTMRGIFDRARTFVGVDLIEGPGVDVVQYGHEFVAPTESFDFAVAGECFEHDPHWPKTLSNMAKLTRPGGIVAFTCASRGRPEHGTRRTEVDDSPGTQSRDQDYYRNIAAQDVSQQLDLARSFSRWGFGYMPTSFDLYFCGVRSGDPEGRPVGTLPTKDDVAAIASLMPLSHRLVRLPLRVVLPFSGEECYQDFAANYWRFMDRATKRLLGTKRRGTGSWASDATSAAT